MKTLRCTCIALSLSAFAATLSAQTTTPPEGPRESHRRVLPGPGGGHGGPGRGGPGFSLVRALDTDKDRELSAAELANASASIRTLDADADGVVSSDEIRHMRFERRTDDRPAGAPERKAGESERKGVIERPAGASDRKGKMVHRGERSGQPRPAEPIMLALDANSDGSLSEGEVANATASLTALDLDKDGKLTFDELRPLPPEEQN